MTKLFSEPVYVTRPLMPDIDHVTEKLREVWESQWLSNAGAQQRNLEDQVRRFLNVPHLSLFNNGTIALLVAVQSLRLQGEVITTPFTFPATTHVLAWNGITPVFCDIDLKRMTIDPDRIERLITNRTTGILGVHVYGIPCHVDRIQEIADHHGLRVIYDAAHAFGTRINGREIGNHGDISMFSFHPTKLFHSAEGGALVCDDANLKQRIDLLKNFGIRNEFEVIMPGINGKMNELSAIVGQLVLEMVENEQKRRQLIREIYEKRLGGIVGVTIVEMPQGVSNSQQYMVIRIDGKKCGVNRDQVYKYLRTHNVFARKYFYPLASDYPCYHHLPSAHDGSLQNAIIASQEVLCLPFYGALKDEQVVNICDLLVSFIETKSKKTNLTLSEYIMRRDDIDVSFVADFLTTDRKTEKQGMIGEAAVRSLMENTRNIDDIICLASIVRRYTDRRNHSLFAMVAGLLEEVGLNTRILTVNIVGKCVTILSAASDGQHLKLVFAYAAALLTQNNISKMNIVFTGEWEWSHWTQSQAEQFISRMKKEFHQLIFRCPEFQNIINSINDRLGIWLAPRHEEMSTILGDVVIRFEGPAFFKSTFIYGKAIHRDRPVVTATYSSHVSSARNCDVTLVRFLSDKPGHIHYVPPVIFSELKTAPSLTNKSGLLIVTAYSHDRIKSGLKAMSRSNGWTYLEALFEKIPNVKWLLVGANDPVLARREIPEIIQKKYGDNIEILGFSDLEQIYMSAFAFLCFPGMFGGGGAASMAIAHGVPVLVYSDIKADIANLIPEYLHVGGIMEAFEKIIFWDNNPDERNKFIMEQQASLLKRMDLKSKGEELNMILNRVINLRS